MITPMASTVEPAAWPERAATGGHKVSAGSRDDNDERLSPATQFVADREAYLGQGRHDLGRRIADDQVELFASHDAFSALAQEIAGHRPLFLAVHDIATSASLRLLASLAGATQGRVHKLTVRRQGHGMALAVLQFVEMPLRDGPAVRVYSTDLSADAATRASVAALLLAQSQLGVLLMGAVPAAALGRQLEPLSQALARGPWPNRELLMVPLGAGLPLAAHAQALSGASGVSVQVTPMAARTRQAWAYVVGAWNRSQGAAGQVLAAEFTPARTPAAIDSSEAPTEPMGLHGRSAAPAALPSPPDMAASARAWQSYVDSCHLLQGAQACCAFDTLSGQVYAQAGTPRDTEALGAQGLRLLGAMNEAARVLGLGHQAGEGSISVGGRHLLLRPVPGHAGVALALLLSASANPTLARLQLERLHPPLRA